MHNDKKRDSIFTRGLGIMLGMGVCLGILNTSCGTAPVNSYYTLENVMPAEETLPTTPVCQAVLAVESVFVLPPYDLTKVVFRPDDLEVRYYTHRHWVSSPEEMIRKLIVRRLGNENLFINVENAMFVSEPDLTLYTKVHNLEEIDRDSTWNGRLAMSFTLRDDLSGRTVWEYDFDETKPVPEKEVKVVVYTINEIYNRHMTKMVHSMKLFLENHSGCEKNRRPRDYHDDYDEPAVLPQSEDGVDPSQNNGKSTP